MGQYSIKIYLITLDRKYSDNKKRKEQFYSPVYTVASVIPASGPEFAVTDGQELFSADVPQASLDGKVPGARLTAG